MHLLGYSGWLLECNRLLPGCCQAASIAHWVVSSCCSVVATIKYATRVLPCSCEGILGDVDMMLLCSYCGTLRVLVCCYAVVGLFWVLSRFLQNVGRGLKCFCGEFWVVARLNVSYLYPTSPSTGNSDE